MRLIDADVLLNEVKKVCFSKEWLKFRSDYGSNGTRDHIINLIENAETITPFASVEYETFREYERPHGEWLNNRVAFYFTCDYCGCNIRQLKSEVFEGNYNYNFCPNCGAQMDGGAS